MEKFIKIFIPKFLWEKIEKNPELKKILVNINWLFFDRAVQMVVAFLVGVLVIRYLGPEKYGILSYAVAFVSLFGFIASLGMDEIAVREFVKKPEKNDELLGTLFFLRLMAGFIALFFSVIIIYFIKHDDALILWIVFIIALGFIFKSSSVIDFWFQSQVKSKYVVYVASSVSIISGLIKIALVLTGASLILFAWVILFESVAFFLGLLIVFLINNKTIKKWKINISTGKTILSASWPLIISSVAVSFYMKIDQVMIGNMLDTKAVGIYSAAVALSEMWYFIPTIIASSVFPAIIYSKKISMILYYDRIRMLYGAMIWISIIVAIIVTLFSKQIIIFLYGAEYIQSAGILSIYIWSGVAVFIGVAWSKWILIENKQKLIVIAHILGAILNIILNFIWLPIYGIRGAAFATLLSYFISEIIAFSLYKPKLTFSLLYNALIFKKVTNHE